MFAHLELCITKRKDIFMYYCKLDYLTKPKQLYVRKKHVATTKTYQLTFVRDKRANCVFLR